MRTLLMLTGDGIYLMLLQNASVAEDFSQSVGARKRPTPKIR